MRLVMRGCGSGRRRGRGSVHGPEVGVRAGEGERRGHGQAGIQAVVSFSHWFSFPLGTDILEINHAVRLELMKR